MRNAGFRLHDWAMLVAAIGCIVGAILADKL